MLNRGGHGPLVTSFLKRAHHSLFSFKIQVVLAGERMDGWISPSLVAATWVGGMPMSRFPGKRVLFQEHFNMNELALNLEVGRRREAA